MSHDELSVLPRHEMSPEVRARTREHILSHLADPAPPAPAHVVRAHRTGPSRYGRRWATAVTALAASAAGIVAGVAMVAGAEPVWAAEPQRLAGDGLQAARLSCESALHTVPRSQVPQAVQAVVGERRGATSSVQIAGSRNLGICIGTTTTRLSGIVDLPALPSGTSLTVDGSRAS